MKESTITRNSAGNGGAEGSGAGGEGPSGGANGASGGTGFNLVGGPGGFGGGISGPGSVVLESSTLSGNRAGDGGPGGDAAGGRGGDGTVAGGTGGSPQAGQGGLGGRGGAVSAQSVTALNVTMDDNAAGDGGPGGMATGGTGGNATNAGGIGGNGGSSSGGTGGFGGNGGALWTSGSLGVTSATVSANRFGRAGAGIKGVVGLAGHGPGATAPEAATRAVARASPRLGGAVQVAGGTASLADTIVADDTVPSCAGGAVADGGHNLSTAGDNSCPGTAGDARLALLGDYGGLVETRALKPGSAARDQVPAAGASCPATDARGVARPQGGACDIGAYEVAPPSVTTGQATGIGPDTAGLGAIVSPNGRAAAYHFEYGPSTAYGSRTADGDGGTTTSGVSVSAALAGLTPSTTYHYRVVATNAEGTSAGGDMQFTTAAPGVIPPPPDTTAPVISKLSPTRARLSRTRCPSARASRSRSSEPRADAGPASAA